MNLNNTTRSILTFIFFFLFVSQAFCQWETSKEVDPMTDKVSIYAHSPTITANKPMSAPYSGTKAWLAVSCNGNRERAYIGFSQAPNLSNTETHDGYNEVKTRIRFDDELMEITLAQEWGDRFLNFYYDYEIIPKLMEASTVLLELNWHGNGNTYFRFPLSGSSEAITKIRKECKKY